MQIRVRVLIFGFLALALRETDAKADGLLGNFVKEFGASSANMEVTINPRIARPDENYPPRVSVKPLSEEQDPRCGRLTEQQRQQTPGCNNQR